jgi:SAM-dependent methyltransferase
LFGSFDYSLCQGTDQESLQSALGWVRLTTALTRYEAALFRDLVPWHAQRNWLDLGGNSGEFAIQICNHFPELRATVVDLPAVCALGRKHVESYGMTHRIDFQPGDFLKDPWSGLFDVITFKSVLHDWPDQHARVLLQKAWDHLTHGGRLVVLERVNIPGGQVPLGFGQSPVWMFWNHYRSPGFYESFAAEYLNTRPETRIIQADMPWMALQMVKAPSEGQGSR